MADSITLYHGSYVPVERIDLEKCRPGRDFGRGFYLTGSRAQAAAFIRTSLKKAKAASLVDEAVNCGYVSVYSYRKSDDIPVYSFQSTGKEWLWFVAQNRKKELAGDLLPRIPPEILRAEIITGKIANDTTNRVITAYLNGVLGPVGSDFSADIAIRQLMPERLNDQYCFLTARAIGCLTFIGAEKYE